MFRKTYTMSLAFARLGNADLLDPGQWTDGQSVMQSVAAGSECYASAK